MTLSNAVFKQFFSLPKSPPARVFLKRKYEETLFCGALKPRVWLMLPENICAEHGLTKKNDRYLGGTTKKVLSPKYYFVDIAMLGRSV